MHNYYLKIFILVIYCLSLSYSCRHDHNPDTSLKDIPEVQPFILISPEKDAVYTSGDSISFRIAPKGMKQNADSFYIYSEEKRIWSQTGNSVTLSSRSVSSKVGRQNIRIVIFCADYPDATINSSITILSDETPKELTYKMIRQLPHDTESYTQGLLFYEGMLYEGTGQKTKSKLKKLDPSDGSVILEKKINEDYFGEGIAILDNKIYQLTYLSGIGLVYDLETFNLIREFNLQTSEGWGLTSDGQSLIASDGSSAIYYYDPKYFTQTDQINVCDNQSLITRINELEYVDECIWANIYGKTHIIKIDSKTGKVMAILELKSLIPKGLPDNMDYVLNGIAFNPVKHTYYITGKLWPVIYEIKITE